MRVRWTPEAIDDVDHIGDYIARDRPAAARRVTQTIVQRVPRLNALPDRGRPGRVEGTRELVFAPLPFVAVYEVQSRK
jgi:toxin ParE1/3/4